MSKKKLDDQSSPPLPSGAMLLDMRDIQAALKVSRPTIYELIGDGTLQTLHIGARRLTTPAMLQRCIETLTQRSQARETSRSSARHERRAR